MLLCLCSEEVERQPVFFVEWLRNVFLICSLYLFPGLDSVDRHVSPRATHALHKKIDYSRDV